MPREEIRLTLSAGDLHVGLVREPSTDDEMATWSRGVDEERGEVLDPAIDGDDGWAPCIRGLRVTVSAVVGQLAAGQTIDDPRDHRHLEREDVLAALEYGGSGNVSSR